MNNAPHIRRLAGAMLLWSLALHASAQLVISEAKPSGDEWIEVRNQGNTSVDLVGFTLADDLEDASPWVLPSMTLDAQARVNLNAPFQLSAGEVVTLRSPQGDLVDALPIHPELPWGHSVGRPEESLTGWCMYDAPTPGQPNLGTCFSGIEPAPSLVPMSGMYDAPVVVSLTSNTNGITRYTLDGATPDSDSPIFPSEGLTLNENAVLAVKAFSASGTTLPSSVRDEVYLLDGMSHELPVWNVMTAPDNLFDVDSGMYVFGNDASNDYPYFGANFWEPWSKPARLVALDAMGNVEARGAMDLEIHGGWSRAEPQKSFRFDFKQRYTGNLELPLFSEKPGLTSFNNLNVRNGGQHVWATKMQDALLANLALETHCLSTAWRPLELYLNGEYWGLYAAREKTDEHYVAGEFDVPVDGVTLLNPQGALAGDASSFYGMQSDLLSTPPTGAPFLDAFEAAFNTENYFDYFILETFFQNTDWMGIAWGLNNTKICKPSANHRWHYVLYDTDACLGYFGAAPSDNYLEYARNPGFPNAHSLLFNHVLNHPVLWKRFVNRYADLINTLFQPASFQSRVGAFTSQIEGTLPQHIGRWQAPESMAAWDWFVNNMVQHELSRVTSARVHLQSSFGLYDQCNCTLDAEPNGAGHVRVNTIVPGPLPWQGIYFEGCPIELEAQANPGFMFDRWDPNLHTAAEVMEESEKEQSVAVFLSDTYRAQFVPCPDDASASLATASNVLSVETLNVPFVDSVVWFLEDQPLGTGFSWPIQNSGVYSADVHFDGCTVSVSEMVTADIQAVNHPSVHIHPNPASMRMELFNLLPGFPWEIVNGRGQTVQQGEGGSVQVIDVSSWPAGTYVLSQGAQRTSFVVSH